MKPLLSPKDLAEAIGVSESSVKRWVDGGLIQASRTAGGHRRIRGTEAVRFIRDSGQAVVRPELLGLRSEGPTLAVGEDPAEHLFRHLRAGDDAAARSLVQSLYLEGSTVAEIVDGPLASAMKRLGELWKHSGSGIFWEHRATEIAARAMAQLRTMIDVDREGPPAVGGAGPGDPYVLPSQSVAAVLEDEGLRAVNPGPNTPIHSLRDAAEELEAEVVWLTCSHVIDADGLADEVEEIAGQLGEAGRRLVVGGRAIDDLRLAEGERLFVGSSMGELRAWVRGLGLVARSAGGASG